MARGDVEVTSMSSGISFFFLLVFIGGRTFQSLVGWNIEATEENLIARGELGLIAEFR